MVRHAMEAAARHARSGTTAISYYDDILKADGPPGATSNGFNENLALFASGHCGMWIDATVAGGLLYDTKQIQVADKVGFAPMPTGSFTGGADLAVELEPGDPGDVEAAGRGARRSSPGRRRRTTSSWWRRRTAGSSVPPGTRQSTYDNPEYQKAAPFAGVRAARRSKSPIRTARREQPRPYTGAQFVAIPEFQGIGTQVGQTIAGDADRADAGGQALKTAQAATERTMRRPATRSS